jgi:hypothetical protein
MLKNKKMESIQYAILKLVTSEVIVGRLESDNETGYTLEYPMVINYSYDVYNAKTQIYLTSLNPFNKEQNLYTIKKSHVIFQSDLDAEFIDYYEKYVQKKIAKELLADEYTPEADPEDIFANFLISPNTTVN